MAYNPSQEVADCREVSRKWKMQQIIIVGIDQYSGKMKVASYGETRGLCSDAKLISDDIYKAVQEYFSRQS